MPAGTGALAGCERRERIDFQKRLYEVCSGMKVSDDYLAKIRIWARNPQVVTLPRGPAIPKFSSQRFSSHEEMNRWKEKLLQQMARKRSPHG